MKKGKKNFKYFFESDTDDGRYMNHYNLIIISFKINKYKFFIF